MNKPTSVLGQARRRIGPAGKRGGMVTITRRCVCVLALVLLFSPLESAVCRTV